MNPKKQHYETPATDVWEVSMERNLLQVSVTRESYGTATTEDWE